MKAQSTLNTAFVIAVVTGIVGGVIMVATTDTQVSSALVQETTHSGFYFVGVILVGVSGLFAQYAIIGWAIKAALREHAAEHKG